MSRLEKAIWTLAIFALAVMFACVAQAIQCVYPNGDEDNATYYWDTPGASSTHYTLIDDDTACDGTNDGATTELDEDDGSVYRMLLTDPTDPESSSGHTWYCYAYRSSNKTHSFTVDLYEGGTKINTSTSCTTSALTGSYAKEPGGGCTLSASEADAIGTYSDLRIYITASGSSPTNVYVTSCNLELPDAPGGADEIMVIGR